MCNFLKKILLIFLVIGVFILSTSCKKQQNIQEIKDTQTINPLLNPSPTVAELAISSVFPTNETEIPPNNELPRTKYDLNVWYDYSQGVLTVDEEVTFFNSTSRDLEIIPFILPFKAVNEFKIQEIMIDNEVHSLFEFDSNTLFVTLLQPLKMRESVVISIEYMITIPDTGGFLGRTSQQVNLADFYPIIPPYTIGGDWVINQPGAVGEYITYELSDYKLEFSTNAPEDIIVFSNSHIEKINDVYTINAEKYRNVLISMCTRCTRIENDYSGFKVIGSFDSQDESKGQITIYIISNALLFFSDTFGVDYPHTEMTIIETDFPDGMEFDGLFFLSKDWFDQYYGTFKNYLSLLTVHETSHQWWYGLVANNQATEPWLDEALATYSEYLFLEEFYPELAAWWWDYRIYGFNPTGNVGSDIYEFDRARPYINAVYLRGAVFLHGLRTLLTDDVFFIRLRQYVQNYQGSISNAEGFKNIFIPEMTADETDLLKNFFEQ